MAAVGSPWITAGFMTPSQRRKLCRCAGFEFRHSPLYSGGSTSKNDHHAGKTSERDCDVRGRAKSFARFHS
jgi:hypothetical protein